MTYRRFRNPLSFLCLALAALAVLATATAATAATAADPVSAANPENPYDDVGSLHNAAMEAAIGARATVGDDPFVLGVHWLEQMRDFACASEGESPCALRLPGLRVAEVLDDPDAAAQKISASLTWEQRAFFDGLLVEVSATERDVAERVQRIRDLEREITAALSSEEARPLLQSASVARHSLVYWHQQAADPTSWNLAPDHIDAEAFGQLARDIPLYDFLGGFLPYWPYFDPIGAYLASMYALLQSILDILGSYF